MLGRSQFESVKQRHGAYASWAVWAPPSEGPKSNIGDLSVLDPDANASLLETLKSNVVIVGLNISRSGASHPFRNFHDPSPKANDFKLRYALSDTPYYGAYMTDVIKNVAMVNSGELLEHLKVNPALLQKNLDTFRRELLDLNAEKPVILALGAASHGILEGALAQSEYASLIKLTHYSHHIGKEQYRDTILAQLSLQPPAGNSPSARTPPQNSNVRAAITLADGRPSR